jgi:hypothetical protein
MIISSVESDRLVRITPRFNTLTVAIARMRRSLLSGTIYNSHQHWRRSLRIPAVVCQYRVLSSSQGQSFSISHGQPAVYAIHRFRGTRALQQQPIRGTEYLTPWW